MPPLASPQSQPSWKQDVRGNQGGGENPASGGGENTGGNEGNQ
jgi:hypothetical protein